MWGHPRDAPTPIEPWPRSKRTPRTKPPRPTRTPNRSRPPRRSRRSPASLCQFRHRAQWGFRECAAGNDARDLPQGRTGVRRRGGIHCGQPRRERTTDACRAVFTAGAAGNPLAFTPAANASCPHPAPPFYAAPLGGLWLWSIDRAAGVESTQGSVPNRTGHRDISGHLGGIGHQRWPLLVAEREAESCAMVQGKPAER